MLHRHPADPRPAHRVDGPGVGKPPAGHVYGWQIEPLTDGECLVTNYCDWTNISDDLRARFRWPVVPADRLQRSVENLDRLATRPGPA